MWTGYVLPLLLGSVLCNPLIQRQDALSSNRNSQRSFKVVKRQSYYETPTRYMNSTRTTATTTTTTLITSTSTSTSIAVITTTSTQSTDIYTTSNKPPDFIPPPASSEPTCLINSTVTYTGTRDPTVTITKDVTETTTLTGKSFYASPTPQVTVETQRPPCYSITLSSTRATTSTTTTRRVYSTSSGVGMGSAESTHYYPSPTSAVGTLSSVAESPTNSEPSLTTTTAAASSAYTSTAYVTRKTIIPYVPNPSQPPFSFDDQPNKPYSSNDGNGGGSGKPGDDGAHGNDGGPNPGNTPGDSGSDGSDSGSHVTSPAPPPSGTQMIGGEAVTYNPTAVIIGGSTVPIPTNHPQNPPQITVNGQTFTINPSQIIGPGTTFNLPHATAAVSTITQPPSTVVVDGVTVTMGISQAVISGTSYRMGIPSNPQTITVNGHTLTINSKGVIFPTTTLSPPLTIGVSGNDIYRIVVIDGITVSVEGTDAIISGTTYKIGSAAGTASTVTIDGKTVTAGPDGLAIGGTTVEPTSIDRTATMTATEGAGPTNSQPAPTDNGGTQSSSSPKENVSSSFQSLRRTLTTLLFTLVSAQVFVI